MGTMTFGVTWLKCLFSFAHYIVLNVCFCSSNWLLDAKKNYDSSCRFLRIDNVEFVNIIAIPEYVKLYYNENMY